MYVGEISVVLHQDQDDCSETHGIDQQITVSVVDAGAGEYLVFGTERWAIESGCEITGVFTKILSLYQSLTTD